MAQGRQPLVCCVYGLVGKASPRDIEEPHHVARAQVFLQNGVGNMATRAPDLIHFQYDEQPNQRARAPASRVLRVWVGGKGVAKRYRNN